MDTPSTSSQPEKQKSAVASTIEYVTDLMGQGPDGVAGRGLELGLGAVIGKTALKRLPVPLNFVAPILVQKVILKHGVPEGRELLLKGLKWIKRATDDKSEPTI